jgi:hypothetical protein
MAPRFQDLFREAFNARPIGMFVPPNWVGLGAFALLGLVNPGLWVIGAGLEVAYLFTLTTHPRFQRYVSGSKLVDAQKSWRDKVARVLAQLAPEDRERYTSLEQRCRGILDHQLDVEDSSGLAAQGAGLSRLLWIHLRLLATRASIRRVLRDPDSGAAEARDDIAKRAAGLTARLKNEQLADDLRKSLSGQLEILEQRLAKQQEARDKLAFLEAELMRIQEQVELIREQAMLATDSTAVSERIDQVAATLGGTTQWIQEQQKLYGQVEDLVTDTPPMLVTASKESQ